jgi:hypothetical protein
MKMNIMNKCLIENKDLETGGKATHATLLSACNCGKARAPCGGVPI